MQVTGANDTYSDFPDHPLHDVPQSVLDAARSVLRDNVSGTDVDAEMAEPIADAVVIEVLPEIRRWLAG